MRSTRSIAAAAAAVLGIVCARPALAMPSYITNTGTWTQGNNGATQLVSSTDHFCYLTRVTGHFVGGGEWVDVYSDSTTQSWYVGGGSLQQGVSASANCLPYSTFIPEPSGETGPSWTAAFSVNTGFIGSQSCPLFDTCPPNIPHDVVTTNGWQGDAALMLSGINGQFNGGGEFVRVDQAGNATTYNTLNAGAQSPNGVGGFAQVLFVGIPQSGFLPAFYGPNTGFPASANNAGVYSASASAGNPAASVIMAPTSAAICYFTRISGAFAGGGESVSIAPTTLSGVEFWILHVTSQQGNGTTAEARCYRLNQSQSMG